jgi:hypothetical protein
MPQSPRDEEFLAFVAERRMVPLLISNGTSGPGSGAQAGSTLQASAPAAGHRGTPIALVAYSGQQPAGSR